MRKRKVIRFPFRKPPLKIGFSQIFPTFLKPLRKFWPSLNLILTGILVGNHCQKWLSNSIFMSRKASNFTLWYVNWYYFLFILYIFMVYFSHEILMFHLSFLMFMLDIICVLSSSQQFLVHLTIIMDIFHHYIQRLQSKTSW